MNKTSQKKKYLMWYKVNKLFSEGLHKTQIGSILGLHRQTVSKYLSMSEDEFLSSDSFNRHYSHKLDDYEVFVSGQLSKYPFLSSSQIHDRLKEKFNVIPAVTSKTVFNFVSHVRKTHNIPKHSESDIRAYEKQPETPYGVYAQVDFGQRWMRDIYGSTVKVYFFAMVLCRSRYKYIIFSKTPFTTFKSVYAHELAFKHFNGIPKKIIYDQDKVFLVNENFGDLILTKGFRAFVREYGFEAVFCHKSDPESKGKIENVVKYVKYNFLRGREFKDIDSLNQEAMGWLSRTANGTEHSGTRLIPSSEFEEEKPHLMPYNGTPELREEKLVQHHVRKDNVIVYRGNYYSVPTKTYHGHDTTVYVEEKDGILHIYNVETGKTIAEHKLCCDKGQFIRNTNHMRDREASLNDYEDTVRSILPAATIIDDYLSKLRDVKKRNYRDNLQFIYSKSPLYTPETIVEAFSKCMDTCIFNGNDLMNVAERLRINKKEELKEIKPEVEAVPSADTYDIIPTKTNINSYNPLFYVNQ